MPLSAWKCSHIVSVLSLLLSSLPVLCQGQPPQSDAQAVALATQAIAALTGSTVVGDVTLTGNATWIAGSDVETGPVTLLAKGTGESRVDLTLSGGTRTEIRNDIAGPFPQGAFIDNGGGQQPRAMHNCWTSASWFFPALSLLSAVSDPPWSFHISDKRAAVQRACSICAFIGTLRARSRALFR